MNQPEEQSISPKLYKLITIGFVMYIALICLSSFLGTILYTLSLLAGLDLMTAFWVSEIMPIIAAVVSAYLISRRIWKKTTENPETIHKSLQQMIIFMIVVWVFQFCYPLLLQDLLLAQLPKVEGFYFTLEQRSTMDIAHPILNALQMLLLVVAVALRK